ncbi:hypothetical protein IV102_37080 [bacterium]|nr:hypothetical protein [bacterium]
MYELRPRPGAAPAPLTPTPVPMAVEVVYSLSAAAPAGTQLVVHFSEIPQDLVVPLGSTKTTRQSVLARASGPVTRVSLTLTGPHLHQSTSPTAPIQQGRADVGELDVRAQKAPTLRLTLPTETPVAPPEDPMPVPSDSWDAKL